MSGLSSMKKRIGHYGKTNDERIVESKYNSFSSALYNSYQGEDITFKGKNWRCLINPERLQEEFDQKIISIDFEADMHEGDVFYWDRTGSHWIVYLQFLEEEAYFRARIRRCDYQINGWWVWFNGPKETSIDWRLKHDIYFNTLNYTANFFVTKTPETLEYFSRFKIVTFEGHRWRVSATDKYSHPGLIAVYLEEYYDNEMEDLQIQDIPEKPDQTNIHIEGPQQVYPYDKGLSYSLAGLNRRLYLRVGGVFVVNSNKVKIVEQSNGQCTLQILTGKSAKFTLSYVVDDEEVTAIDIVVKPM